MPREAYGVATLVAALISLLFLATYSGPVRLIGDLQLSLWNIHFVTVSYLLTMAVVAAPLCGLVYVLEKRFGTRVTWFSPLWDNLDGFFDLPPGKGLLIGGTLFLMGGGTSG